MDGIHICSLRSSSKGNATLVFSENTKVLVDCGISCKMALSALSDINVLPSEIDGIFVTHEHSDHIKGIELFSKRYDVPVFANSDTWSAMRQTLSGVSEGNVRIIEDEMVLIGDIKVCAFPIPHDAANPVGYTFYHKGEKVAVATDMGMISETVIKAIEGAKTVLLEANHDENLLLMGRYPDFLKRRIKSDKGHLCNDRAGEMAEYLMKNGTKSFILGHLSAENNNPHLAYVTVLEALKRSGEENKDFVLKMTYPDKTGEVV